jgi:uncharacterized protein
MGYKEIEIKLSVNASSDDLRKVVGKALNCSNFSFRILKKSLDARNKKIICWQYRLGVNSEAFQGIDAPVIPTISYESRNRKSHVVVVGSGPAGIFSALLLSLSGYKVTLLERGSNVEARKKSIHSFEMTGRFDPENNYAFGEGGAGTFSDGKLTSRTKSINQERNFIYDQFINAGAPGEIAYMTHPHLGTDNLFRITCNMRRKLIELGCEMQFDQKLIDLSIKHNKIHAAITESGSVEGDYFVLATGHSAYETYRMLIDKGVPFQTKNFAIGFRAEHRQEIINMAQWGIANLPGLQAAEYRLTSESSDRTPVYSFCMCPGGIVVPATAYKNTNVVNGMSFYKRDKPWANAAVVAGVNLERLLKRPVSASETLEWLEELEAGFFKFSNSYNAPAATINDFLENRKTSRLPESSYPFSLVEADFTELLPAQLIQPLKEGLKHFIRKLKGYETGIILGLESKTSSPIQVKREENLLCAGFQNLYIAGEGSGWAGGIISSAADGLRVSQQLMHIAK